MCYESGNIQISLAQPPESEHQNKNSLNLPENVKFGPAFAPHEY
jgi:hypothetical protein